MPCIYKTTNGGVTWVNAGAPSMYSSSTSFANFVTFFTASVGITIGDPVSNDYEIYRTSDGGTTWVSIPGSAIPDAQTNES